MTASVATVSSDPVPLLRDLLRFDTSNPPGNERACLEFLAHVLGESGIEARLVAVDPERPNLVARIRGRGRAAPLLLHAHVDVVPANPAEWRHPPFAGELVDGEVWGRGALDMKGDVAMLVTALLRVHAEAPPAGDVVLALLSAEETGSEPGAKFLVEERAELFDGVRFAISEGGGACRWIHGRRFYPISVSEKQRCLVRATVRGRGGHASLAVRGTAMEKLGALLSALGRRRFPPHLTPVVREMLRTMAPALPLHERAAMRTLAVPALTDRVLGLFGEDGAALDPLLHNTATPTVVRGGKSTNVIPTEVTVELDGRVVPGQTPADLVRELEALAPGLATYEVVREEPPLPREPDLTLFPLLADIVRARDPGAIPFPLLLPGYTDARYFARLGIQTYGFLPLRVPPDFPHGLVHAPDERVPADALRFGAACVYEALRRYGDEAPDRASGEEEESRRG